MIRWSEKQIRRELRRLDRMTGLDGSSLSIFFNRSKQHAIASFVLPSGSRPYFTFTVEYFHTDDYPDATLLDVIRHEYAHYMVHTRHPGLKEDAHGPTWKKYCLEIGATPEETMNAQRARSLRQQERLKDAEENPWKGQLNILHPGDSFLLPVFGKGIVSGISQNAANPSLTLTCADGVRRSFPARWVLEKCTKL